MKFQFTAKSRNPKTGPIAVTTSEQKTCPSACPLKNAGCYADGGPLAIVWRRVSETGMNLDELCKGIAKVKPGAIWRHNQAGDLAHKNQLIDRRALSAIVKANTGRRGFTYTHHKMGKQNRDAVARANRDGFTINLSANNPAHADELAAHGIAPVVTVLPVDASENSLTPGGRKITICPAITGKAKNCAECKLCAVVGRKTIIGFPAHGMRKRVAGDIAKQGVSA